MPQFTPYHALLPFASWESPPFRVPQLLINTNVVQLIQLSYKDALFGNRFIQISSIHQYLCHLSSKMAQVWAMLTSATGGPPSSCTRAEIFSPYLDPQFMYGKYSISAFHCGTRQAQSRLGHVRSPAMQLQAPQPFNDVCIWIVLTNVTSSFEAFLIVFERWAHTGSIGFLPSTLWHNTHNHPKSLFSIAISMIFIAFEFLNCKKRTRELHVKKDTHWNANIAVPSAW